MKSDPSGDSARETDVVAATLLNAETQFTRDLYECGRGAVGLTGLVLATEAVATIAPAVFGSLALASAKEAEQGCGGLLCTAITNDPAADKQCHDALDYVDPTRQAGFVLGAIATGNGTRANESGLVFAASGDLYEAVERIGSGDLIGTIDKAYSFRNQVADLVKELSDGQSDLELQPVDPVRDWDPPDLPGRGDVDGSDIERTAMWDNGPISRNPIVEEAET